MPWISRATAIKPYAENMVPIKIGVNTSAQIEQCPLVVDAKSLLAFTVLHLPSFACDRFNCIAATGTWKFCLAHFS
jgi:hypothetical protein